MSTISAFAVCMVCVATMLSCSKESDTQARAQPQASPGQSMNVTINADEIYTLAYEKATELNIYKQAAHFKESLTAVNNETGQVIYKYIPAIGFRGEDQVTLSRIKKEENNNTSGCYFGNYGNDANVLISKAYTTIKITVK